ncbi:hypothetical protein [Streptomyces sp. G1]|uniref:hypothetical protein n=1 Tax=Streptomyces sp. G1 TaxID=361572 RepID=UPI00202E2DAA|nr:hypothetical protein [Streptomyces sp. G1]MCM1964907.1 hypothetical protein [Streptomyces sp. G1]
MSEPFGPDYEEPPAARADCPNCGCCSARLCQAGRDNVQACVGLTAAYPERVRDCPCSSDLTAGTLAWRRARVVACRHASEMPFGPNVEAVMRAAGAGEPLDVDSPEVQALTLCHFLAPGTDAGGLVLTELGVTYLRCRDEPRFQSPLVVLSVDPVHGTAAVLVTAWSDVTAVTVPLIDLLTAVGEDFPLPQLPGQRLMCTANAWAEDVEDVVVTAVQVVPPPAEEEELLPPPAPETREPDRAPEPAPEPEEYPLPPPFPPTVPAAPPASATAVLPLHGQFVRVDGRTPVDPRTAPVAGPPGLEGVPGE